MHLGQASIGRGRRKDNAVGFWDFFWLMIWGFFFVAYLMVLFQVIVDVFRDRSLLPIRIRSPQGQGTGVRPGRKS